MFCHCRVRPLKSGTVQIIGAAQSRILRRSGFIPADEDAVMMYRILIQQTSIQKLPDLLDCDAPLTEIGEDPSVIRIAGRQGKRLLLADRLWLRNGCVSGFPKDFPQNCWRKVMASPPVFREYRNQVRRSLIRRLSISAVVWKRPTRLT